jgi:hypothetical protein
VQAWDEVVKAALVGTERQALAFPAGADPIGRLLEALNTEERERSLLRACALLAGCRRAGYRPPVAEDALPPQAEADERPPVRPEVAQDLLVMLRGQFREALPEWCQAVAEKGGRVPEEHLAEFLDFGRGHSEYRDAFLPVLGKRGRWLAAQNSEWKYALQFSLFEIESAPEPAEDAEGAAETVWQTGTKEERVALLHRLRRTEPARATALVESTWTQDAPEERAAFLATFEAGLSMADEPLLEGALDDRRKEVRTLAQNLLPRLPESRLCQRVWERVQPLVQWKRAVMGTGSIAVALPRECDKAMVRDGIEPKPTHTRFGERAWWLKQSVERVPLSYWSREWDRPPAEALAAKRPSEWKALLREAWTAALPRSGDPRWAVALFAEWIEEQPEKLPDDIAWKDLLPLDVFEAGVLRLMEGSGKELTYGHPVYSLLSQYRAAWNPKFALVVIERLRTAGMARYYLADSIAKYAPFIPLEARDAFFALWNEVAQQDLYLRRQIDTYLALNDFRTEMRRRIDAA